VTGTGDAIDPTRDDGPNTAARYYTNRSNLRTSMFALSTTGLNSHLLPSGQSSTRAVPFGVALSGGVPDPNCDTGTSVMQSYETAR